MKLTCRHPGAIKWGCYLPHWTQYHLPHLITQQSAVPCYYIPNIHRKSIYKRHFMVRSGPASILTLLQQDFEWKGFYMLYFERLVSQIKLCLIFIKLLKLWADDRIMHPRWVFWEATSMPCIILSFHVWQIYLVWNFKSISVFGTKCWWT